MVHIQNGSTTLLWEDLWNNKVRSLDMPELFSITTENRITVRQAVLRTDLADIFHLPLTEQAYHQFLQLNNELEDVVLTEETDSWTYIWGSSQFLVHKAYNALTGHNQHMLFLIGFGVLNANQSIGFSFRCSFMTS
jgi:hypothetical protein